MPNEELNIQLYERLFAEQEKYRSWLLTLPPGEALNHASEYLMRKDILRALEYHDLTDGQAKALRKSLVPLADVFKDWEKRATGHRCV